MTSAETDVLRAMADHVVMLPLAAVLAGWRDGDERGWQAEFDMLRLERTTRIDMLASSIQTDGIRLPILLGSDGRVWDGHHRLCAADLLGLPAVPCAFADPGAVVIHRMSDAENASMSRSLADEHRRHVAQMPYGNPGLTCSCGEWADGPIGPYRPWSAWYLHVGEALAGVVSRPEGER